MSEADANIGSLHKNTRGVPDVGAHAVRTGPGSEADAICTRVSHDKNPRLEIFMMTSETFPISEIELHCHCSLRSRVEISIYLRNYRKIIFFYFQ
jgi:hypothetical protein